MNRNGKNIEPNEPLKIIHALVSEQAKDEELWFIAETAPEGYLQKHLRNLHALVDFLWSMEGVNNPNRQEQGRSKAHLCCGRAARWVGSRLSGK